MSWRDPPRPRLTDFGIARIGGESSVTTSGMVLGTVSYMAPEALTGAEPAPACDVYAAGLTLYELLVGQPPFTGQAAMVIYDHLHATPRRPDGLPDPLWQVIAACLDKDPAARPAAAELAAALRTPELAGDETLTHLAGPGQRETTNPGAPNARPHTVTGIGWLSPAGPASPGPLSPGPLSPGPAPPIVAAEPANLSASGKRWRIWAIAAAALVLVGAGVGAFAASGSGGAATPAADSLPGRPPVGLASPDDISRSFSSTPSRSVPTSSRNVRKAASRPGRQPASPASSPVASHVAPADTAGSAPPPVSDTVTSTSTAAATPATAATPAAPATVTAAATPGAAATPTVTAPTPTPTPSPFSLNGATVTNLQVAHVYPAFSGSNGAVQVTWDQVPGATSYTVFMAVKGSFSTDRALANEGGLAPGPHEVTVTPEPGGRGLSVSFTIPKAG